MAKSFIDEGLRAATWSASKASGRDLERCMIWDLFQHHQIRQLDESVDRVQSTASQNLSARQSTLDLEETVDRLVLVSCALFELLQETTGVSEEKLRAKIVEIDLRDGQ